MNKAFEKIGKRNARQTKKLKAKWSPHQRVLKKGMFGLNARQSQEVGAMLYRYPFHLSRYTGLDQDTIDELRERGNDVNAMLDNAGEREKQLIIFGELAGRLLLKLINTFPDKVIFVGGEQFLGSELHKQLIEQWLTCSHLLHDQGMSAGMRSLLMRSLGNAFSTD